MPATGLMDATSVVFVNGTRVNTAASFGFTDASSPSMPIYCVAPVTNAAGSLKRIEYWAAGINCCGQNKPFTCREAQDPNAHGGLLLSPTKQGGPAKKFFQNAMKGARDKYGLIAGNDYLLLDWVAKPIAFRDDLWHNTWKLFAVFAGVYLIISAMVGFVILPILRGK
ncbi:unnamed protein product [Effrenium voratum]|nr:unnamed protein product [Effrenium voratum]